MHRITRKYPAIRRLAPASHGSGGLAAATASRMVMITSVTASRLRPPRRILAAGRVPVCRRCNRPGTAGTLDGLPGGTDRGVVERTHTEITRQIRRLGQQRDKRLVRDADRRRGH
jgi:hypothetical protein